MPNVKALQAAAERRRSRATQAQRVYASYGDQVAQIIEQLDDASEAERGRAYKLLFQMSDLIVDDLLVALENPDLPARAADVVVEILGVAGDPRSGAKLRNYFSRMQDQPNRALLAALSLASIGDETVLPYIRNELDNCALLELRHAVNAFMYLGQLEDINRLRGVHHRITGDSSLAFEVRRGIARAILAILSETSGRFNERTLDQIRMNFADRDLWKDISQVRETTQTRYM